MHRFTKDGPQGGLTSAAVEELSPEELYLAGTQYFKLRDYALARACFERYLEGKPEDAAAWHLLARVCVHQNTDLDKAEFCVKKALEIDRTSLTSYIETLGVIYMHRGQYVSAEEVFAYALKKDTGNDKRHTASLEYYYKLAKKKNKGRGKEKLDEYGAPQFLATDMGRWRTQKRQPWFLIPSILLHVAVLLVVAYLSTHQLPFMKESKEDFTYVDFEVKEPPPTTEEAVAPTGAGERPVEENKPQPAPITPGKAVETGDVQKEPSKGPGQVKLAEKAANGSRSAIGRKAGGNIPDTASKESQLLGKAGTMDKGLDIKGKRMAPEAGDVNLVRKSLGEAAPGEGKAASRAEAVKGLSERSGQANASSDEGIFLGGPKQDKSDNGKKRKTAGIKGEAKSEEAKASPNAGAEKRLEVGIPARDKTVARDDTKGLLARAFSIGAGPSSPASQGAAGRELPRSLDRTGSAGGATASDLNTAASPQTLKRSEGGKAKGVMSGPGGDKTMPQFNGTDERQVDLPETAGSRRIASAESVPMRKSLDMPGTGGQSGGAEPASQGRAARGAPSGLDRKDTGGPAPGFSGGAVSPAGGRLGGYKGAVGTVKAANPGAMGQKGGGGAHEGEGLFARAVDKVSGILGIGGNAGKGGVPDALPRKAGDLSGLASSGTGGGTGGSGQGGRGAAPVRIGGGEKSRTAVPGASGAAGELSTAESGRADTPAGKKMAEGLLGVPGGSGADRYASARRGESRPGGAEKKSAIGRGGKVQARNSVGPMVAITSPSSGLTRQLSQVIRGNVSDLRTRKAVLTVNNDSRVISVERGFFESVISIRKGRNIITVTAFDLDGNAGKDSVTLDYSEPTAGAPVNIISPRDGQVFDVTEKSVTRVKGTIGDQEIKKAKLILNERPMDIVVNRGYFEQDVALVQEHNTILVEASNREGQVSRSPMITVSTVNVKPKDIMIILTWDKPHADMDLHVYGPGGGHTYYKTPSMYESSEAIPGGQLEQDSKGNFGPEVYTQGKADTGTYQVKSNYFYSGGDGDCNSTVTIILYGDNPSRRIMRVFGPHLQVDTKTGEDTWEITKFKMPEGIFLED